jgi:hypothetical protein
MFNLRAEGIWSEKMAVGQPVSSKSQPTCSGQAILTAKCQYGGRASE